MDAALDVALVDLRLPDSKATVERLSLRIGPPLPDDLCHGISRFTNVDVSGPFIGTDLVSSHHFDAPPLVGVVLDISSTRFNLNSRHDSPRSYVG